jgi:hypothetical protein
MPVSHRVDLSRGCVMTTFEGTVTTSEILANADVMSRNEEVDHCHVELVDLTAVVGDEVDTSVIREVAANLKHAIHIKRMAVLASSELQYGLARMFQAYAGDAPVEVSVFRERGEALSWLGLA